MTSSCPLLALPNELLLLIQSSIAPGDLLTHVCFSQLHPRTHACYARNDPDETFWRELLYENGLGAPRTLTSGWRAAAVAAAEHAWTCTHPTCGVARLQGNQTQLRWARESFAADDWSGRPGAVLCTRQRKYFWNIADCDVLRHVGFNNAFPECGLDESARSEGVARCAFLRVSRRSDEGGWRAADLMEHHPIALQSFATFPPVKRCLILHIFPEYRDVRMEAENEQGVTVHDLLTALAKILDKPLTANMLTDLMYGTDWNTAQPFPPTWSAADSSQAVACVGNWFQVNLWAGLEFGSRSADGTVCRLTFSRNKLPADASAHMTKYACSRKW